MKRSVVATAPERRPISNLIELGVLHLMTAEPAWIPSLTTSGTTTWLQLVLINTI